MLLHCFASQRLNSLPFTSGNINKNVYKRKKGRLISPISNLDWVMVAAGGIEPPTLGL
jgi:hypothetical protein